MPDIAATDKASKGPAISTEDINKILDDHNLSVESDDVSETDELTLKANRLRKLIEAKQQREK